MPAEIYEQIAKMTEEEAKQMIEKDYPIYLPMVEKSIEEGGTYKGNLEFLVSFG